MSRRSRTNVRSAALIFLLLFPVSLPGHSQENLPLARARRILDLLRQEKFTDVAAEFNAQVAAALSAERLGQVWAGLKGQVGEFKSGIDEQSAEPQPGIVAVTLGCRFERASINFIVAFDKDGRIAGLRFIPRPPPGAAEAPPSRFKEEPVEVGSGEWALSGTITLPEGGAVAAVVLVHGSGPNDRDESIGANRPFRDLAWGLAERGIAVLRYDKRTRQHGAKFAQLASFTVREETLDDALLAVGALRSRPQVDPGRVFVLGHSLGATLAPRIAAAAADARIAGLVVMAGYTRPLPEIVIEQTEYLASLASSPSPPSLAGAPPQRDAIRDLKQKAAKAMEPALSLDTPRSELLLGLPAAYWKDLNAYQPAALAATLKIPMLILQGERDYQVTIRDLEGWRQALRGRPDVSIRTYPELNHLFIAGEGRSTPSEYMKPGKVAAAVIDDIAGWIKQTVAK